MRTFILTLIILTTILILSNCSTTEFDTPECNNEPTQEQLNTYICAECDGMKYLNVVCNNGHLDCPVEARGKTFYRVVKYENWKNGTDECKMSK